MAETPARPSIARRLAVWGGLSVAAFLTAVAAILVGFADRASDEAYDRLLLASALSIADAIRIVDGEIIVDVPTAAFSMLAIEKSDRVFHRLSDDRSRTITGYPDLAGDLVFARGRDVAFEDAEYRGFPVRVAATRRQITVAGEPRAVTVVMAETLESRSALSAEIRAYAIAPLLLAGLAAIVMIPLTIRQVLKPIAALTRMLEARDTTDLEPLAPASVPAEIGPLVDTLDHFVGRLRLTLERNRAFLAEAAHQIRTPLASLRTMAELAAGETDPTALRDQALRIRRSAVAASRITDQLLADASVADRLTAGGRETVRLDMLVAEVVNDAVGFTGGRSIRFEIEEAAEGAMVAGEPVALREAVRNLVDNALAYGPVDAPVEVTLARPAADSIAVSVADRGPGIPEGERGRVVKRFERGSGAKAGGSGLGLAIVARVVAAHAGTLTLGDRDGGGLVATIRLRAGGEA